MSVPLIQVLPSPQAVTEAAAERIVAACEATLHSRETFSLCLAGGSTPRATYELLAHPEWASQIDWRRVEIFFGDERAVPPDHPDSNYGMARRALLDHVPIPRDNIHRMKGELEPERAATEYGQLLKNRFGDDGGLDLLLLGMGDDGHTLSLFPRTAALDEPRHRCVANHVPKLDAWRITLTAVFANRSGHVLALVTGTSKGKALSEVLEGDGDPHDYPIKLIQPIAGGLEFLIDADAAGMDAGLG